MAEKSILAYFRSPDQAENALARIKVLRLVDSAIERFDGYAGDGNDNINNPINGNFSSLGNLTLGGDFSDRDAGVLAAANVSASGYSSGGPENRVSGYDILLTMIVQEEDYEEALKIVQDEGAL